MFDRKVFNCLTRSLSVTALILSLSLDDVLDGKVIDREPDSTLTVAELTVNVLVGSEYYFL